MPNCYYTGAGNNTNVYELYSKDRLVPDMEVIHNAAEETIYRLGQKIDYYVNTFTPLSADGTYGEQPTMVFWGPKQLKMLIDLNESSLSLSKWGFNADDELVGYVTIRGFVSAFVDEDIHTRLQQEIAPKAGDLIQMTEYGSDRMGHRGGNFFEVTERRDQDVTNSINPLGGHYVWRLKAKRLEYSFQPGITGERGNDQVYDDTFAGLLTSFYSDELYDYIPLGAPTESQLVSAIDTEISAYTLTITGNYIKDNNDMVIGGIY